MRKRVSLFTVSSLTKLEITRVGLFISSTMANIMFICCVAMNCKFKPTAFCCSKDVLDCPALLSMVIWENESTFF
ncbi:unnamed protein product [Hymenolepis diminuta]|uniref:Uncharacterized protein n=1 Tax=Hymenolepis diminuta TaxID=6216 RepID=A0A564YYA0_HYMDI|nr:unnamed protein product [Hymenolepis diminuta]